MNFSVKCGKRKIKGASGVEWDVDCEFNKNYNIFNVNGLVILYKYKKIDLSSLEHAYTVKMDTGVDKVLVVISDGMISEDILRIARKLGIEIISGRTIIGLRKESKLKELYEEKTYFIEPKYDAKEIEVIVKEEGYLSSGIISRFSSKKHELVGIKLAYIPMYCFTTIIHSIDEEPEIIEAEDVILCFEALSGSLISIEDNELSVVDEWRQVGEIEDDVIDVLKLISELGSVSRTQLEEHFKDPNIDLALDVLMEYGLVEPMGADLYKVEAPPIGDYRSPMEALRSQLKRGLPPCGILFDAMINISKLEGILEAYGLVKDYTILYYPIYLAIIRKEKTGRRIDTVIMIDGISGARLKDIEELILDSAAIKQIDKVISDVESKVLQESNCSSEPARHPHE